MKNTYYVVARYHWRISPRTGVQIPCYTFLRYCGSGRTPAVSLLSDEDLKTAFWFDIRPGEIQRRYNRDRSVQYWSSALYREAIASFLRSLPELMAERDLVGECYVQGIVQRQKKKKWETYLQAAVFKPENFVLAKLVGFNELQDELWHRIFEY